MTPLPPKQGLKQFLDHFTLKSTRRYDTTSTKTRIETHRMATVEPGVSRYDTTSTKTRIETVRQRRKNEKKYKVMTPLPPKQGLKR